MGRMGGMGLMSLSPVVCPIRHIGPIRPMK